MKLKNETAKHISQSLRLIGVAQFISYGAIAFNDNNWFIFVLSGLVFLILEFLGGMILEKGTI
jgi:hypothetical protein